jgi:prepilin-type N-terminal cleavage/methylation domain-containing protein
MRKIYSEKGFTLIELLIVIVIIGILAGVLIALIDPAQQQNRARDAGVKAAMNKVALATQGYISAYGYAPDGAQFIGSLDNASLEAACIENGHTCIFDVTGNPLPTACNGSPNNYYGFTDNGDQCYYYYVRGAEADSSRFIIVAQSHGIRNTAFVFGNFTATASGIEGGEIVECTTTTCLAVPTL